MKPDKAVFVSVDSVLGVGGGIVSGLPDGSVSRPTVIDGRDEGLKP